MGVYRSTPDGTIIEANQTLAEMLGYETACAVKEVDINDLYVKKSDRIGVLKRLHSSGMDVAEFELCRKDGQRITVRDHARAILDPHGKIAYFDGILEDITESKQMEAGLEHEADLLRKTFNSSKEAIFVLDSNAPPVIVECNEAASKIFGYQKAEMLGKTTAFLHMNDESLRQFQAQVYPAIEKEAYFNLEFGMKRRDGSIFPTEHTVTAILDDQRKQVGWVSVVRDITQRKQMEEEIKRERDRAHQYLDLAGVIIVALDTEGRVTLLNRKGSEILGYSAEDAVGKNWIDNFVPPSFRDRVKETLRSLIAGKIEPLEYYENPILCRNGKERLIAWHNSFLRDSAARIVGTLSSGMDITERKEMEEALRLRAEELEALHATVLDITRRQDLQSLLESIVERATRLLHSPSGGFYVCDPERHEVRCVVSRNTPRDYVGTVLGYGEGAAGIVAKTGEPLVVDDYRSWMGRAPVFEEEQPFTALLSVPVIWQGQVLGVIHVLDDKESKRFTKSDLSLLTLLADHAAIAIENERYSAHLEELVAERTNRLAESENKYRSLVENIPDMTWTSDEKGHTVYVSPNVERIDGYLPKEILEGGDSVWLGRVHADDLPRVKEALKSLFAAGKKFDIEYRLRRKDGKWIWVHDRAVSTYEKDGVRFADGLLSDITRQKEVEGLLLKSERLTAIAETAAMVGHDLRNPLQGITTAAFAIEQRIGSTADNTTKEMLELIEKDVQYADRIVKNLFRYSEELQMEPTDTTLKSITEYALHRVEIPNNIVVHDLTERQPMLRLDVGSIVRVFVNLIENAMQAMPQGGELAIESKESNNSAIITFTDTGEGMPMEVMDNLWKPLVSTKAKGIGLGLAICKRLVEAHKGTIHVESTVGKGTTVTLTFPIEIKSGD